ncbi:MAG: insulinase family protein [Spirochaetaceae bacterium]|jgi:Zn-dependent M16 (insulinase) family peptidase|nr:insulinase family protein [Spirochaetaceae bacterium]
MIYAGDKISNFEILDIVELPEFDARGIHARHCRCGAEVFHVHNNDDENLFAFAFATAIANSTGVAHILEHSVLCGSARYQLKDPFIRLAQGSLQTYLNAWTCPDKTIYPASSVNEADYFNLMAVYGDAVFHPKLEEWTFLQEGRRFEIDDSGTFHITGVVYNEMKGAYSSFDEYAQNWALSSVLPGTVYAFDSGGDPEDIPVLSYEQFRAFHAERYAPRNCRVFLAGNISTEKQLAFLNEHFFDGLEPGCRADEIPRVLRWNSPKSYRVDAPAGIETTATVFLAWLCGKTDDVEDPSHIDMLALTEALLGHDGSPLLRALVESPLGEDLASVSGFEADIREPIWAAGLRGVARETAPEAIEELILGELHRLVHQGIPREEIDAALLALEFSHREVRRAGGPWSLVLMSRALRGWFYGHKPWESMVFQHPFEELKRRLAGNKRFFEELLDERLLSNPHRALVSVIPRENFLEKQEARRAHKLADFAASLSSGQLEELKTKNKELEQIQSAEDSPEACAAIPHISVTNLSGDIETVPRQIIMTDGIPVISTKLWTNGICYCNLAFETLSLTGEEYLYLPLFCHVITALGLPGMDYAEVSSLLARTTGDLSASPAIINRIGSSTAGGIFADEDIAGRDWVFFRFKCLDEKFDESLALTLRIIREADFSDTRRLGDLFVEFRNDARASLAPHGSSYAAIRATSSFNEARKKIELMSGLTQFIFAGGLSRERAAEIAGTLSTLRDKLLKGRFIVHLTGEAEKAALKTLETLSAPFARQKPAAQKSGAKVDAALCASHDEIFSEPSLQIGFAAMNFSGLPFSSRASLHQLALAHDLSTGLLWETIRMKGGAYGARTDMDSLSGCWYFSTFRDPKPAASLELFPRLLGEIRPPSQETLEKVIIGTYAKIKHPSTNAQKGAADFVRFLSGVTSRMREERLACLLTLSAQDLAEAAASLLRDTPAPRRIVITGERAAESLANTWNTGVQRLGG